MPTKKATILNIEPPDYPTYSIEYTCPYCNETSFEEFDESLYDTKNSANLYCPEWEKELILRWRER